MHPIASHCGSVMKQTSKVSFSRLLTPLLAAVALAYLGFHLMNGERGLYAWFRETHRQDVLQEQLATTRAERERVERRVSGLRAGSLDLDLLDEQMRRMLGMKADSEKVILLHGENSLTEQ